MGGVLNAHRRRCLECAGLKNLFAGIPRGEAALDIEIKDDVSETRGGEDFPLKDNHGETHNVPVEAVGDNFTANIRG